MADPLSSNVLPFGLPDSAPGTQLSAEASRMLGVCRDRLIQGVASAFAANLGRANDDLLGMADRATSLEQQQLYFTAIEFLAQRGPSLLQCFRSAYVNLFDASLASLRRNRRVEPACDLGDLRLVDTEDFERDLAIGKLSARAACNCANQLTALDRRLAVLLRLPRVGQDDNPLYPRALFAAMLSAFGEMKVGQHLGLTLLHAFERHTASELPGIYNDLNRQLIEHGILPKLPLAAGHPLPRDDAREAARDAAAKGDWRISLTDPGDAIASLPPAYPGAAGALARHPETYRQEPTRSPESAGLAGLTGDEVFAQLVSALQLAVTPAAGPAYPGIPGGAPRPGYLPQPWHQVPAQPGFPPMPGLAHPQSPRQGAGSSVALDLAQLIDSLTRLQRGSADPRGVAGLGPTLIDPSRSSALRQIRSTPLASASAPVDAATIDIVAMLFDAIFNDPDLPAALRAEIAKLQIPALKVALMDKAFFSNERHPTRRLLDVIAGAAIGRSEADEPRLIGKVATIVDDVVAGFETDIGIFALQVAKLEAFLAEEESRAQSRTTPVVDKLQQADREAQASARASAEISQRVHRRTVPTLVADFLDRHWRQALIRAFVRSGDEGAAWVECVGAMDDLLWSVEPKRGQDDRNLLLTTLPDLLKRLRAGLESVDLIGAWDPFFAQLIRLHVGALHNEIPEGEYRRAPAPVLEDSEDSESLPEDREPSHQAARVDPPSRIALHVPDKPESEPERKPLPPLPAEPAADRHAERAQSLEVGAWVEFQSFRGTRKTLRLSWVSELRKVLLFTNRQGENALTIPTVSLAQHLRKGTARVLSPERLTERAVAQLLSKAAAPGESVRS